MAASGEGPIARTLVVGVATPAGGGGGGGVAVSGSGNVAVSGSGSVAASETVLAAAALDALALTLSSYALLAYIGRSQESD